MQNVIIQMAGLILCGVIWRILKPAGLAPVDTRKVLTTLVYYLLLPALVLSVLWRAEIGTSSLQIAGLAAFGVLLGIALGLLSCRICKNQRAESGAIILAIAFPNVLYLGLPVLEATFGQEKLLWSRSVAIQYDLLACSPLLFTVGILLASRFGNATNYTFTWYRELLKIPALWAAFVAVILNVADVPMPTSIYDFLSLLARGVVPLMLFSIGLSLTWSADRWRSLPSLIPVVLFSLILIPAVIYITAGVMGVQGDLRAAIVLEAAMPSMILGIVICDRFNLDSTLYAAAVTVTTSLSIISLPIWHWLLLGN